MKYQCSSLVLYVSYKHTRTRHVVAVEKAGKDDSNHIKYTLSIYGILEKGLKLLTFSYVFLELSHYN